MPIPRMDHHQQTEELDSNESDQNVPVQPFDISVVQAYVVTVHQGITTHVSHFPDMTFLLGETPARVHHDLDLLANEEAGARRGNNE